jgi:hypothetical protein
MIPIWDKPAWDERGFESAYAVWKPEPGSDQEKFLTLESEAARLATKDPKAASQLMEQAERVLARNLISVQDSETYYYIPKDVARYYLSISAARTAELVQADVVTDERRFSEPVISRVPELRAYVAHSVLEAYVPKGFYSLDLQRIAEFRAKLSTERLKYQKEIQSLVAEFSGVSSVDSYESLKRQLMTIAEERIQGIKSIYRLSRIELVAETIGISLTPPAVATAVASALDIGSIAPAGLGAALSLFGASMLIKWNQARAERKQSPWSYVLAVSKL